MKHLYICYIILLYTIVNIASWHAVPLNTNCSVYADVASVEHHPTSRQFRIALKPVRRCARPTFLLRLSGAALYKLDVVHEADRRMVFEYPPVVDAGEYFLDAIVLFCDTFNPENMTGLCMEDARYRKNAVNDPYSFVANTTVPAISPTARWRNTQLPTLLPTRHQMLVSESPSRACVFKVFGEYCFPDRSDVEPYSRYKWVDGVNSTAAILSFSAAEAVHASDASATPSTHGINICFVGDSHSRELTLIAKEYVHTTTDHHRVTFTIVVTLLPSFFHTGLFHEHKCSIAVLSFGQWPLSEFALAPFTLSNFTREMEKVMTDIAAYHASGGVTRTFFRTENYNGLAARITTCPTSDYRSPPAFDAINAAVQRLSAQYRQPYIDLHTIIGPMWDAALDYSHPNPPVLRAELDVILHAVFSHLTARNESVHAYPLHLLNATVTTEKVRFDHGH